MCPCQRSVKVTNNSLEYVQWIMDLTQSGKSLKLLKVQSLAGGNWQLMILNTQTCAHTIDKLFLVISVKIAMIITTI